MNKKPLIVALSLALIGIMALPGSAQQQQGRAAVEQAIRRDYGNGVKFVIYEDREVNGIHVFTAAVEDKNGQANASYTATGDALDLGHAARVEDLPQPVAELVRGVFASTPQLVNVIKSRRYYANLNISGRSYVIEFDASGKILDMGLLSEEEQGVNTA
jgi:hypothetical protein